MIETLALTIVILADLEREGFWLRIRKLQSGQNPHLPDFDGDKIAKERDYRSLSLLAGLRAFEEAREANLSYFHTLSLEDWSKNGTQEGVGDVSLCDMPVFINQHDRAHVDEILAWKNSAARQEHASWYQGAQERRHEAVMPFAGAAPAWAG
jgi:hypothetical protein